MKSDTREPDPDSATNPYASSRHPAKSKLAPPAARGVRVCAALLMVGGISLLLTTAWLWFANDHDLTTTAFYAVFLAVAGVFGFTGIQLWRGEAWAYKTGIVLFIMQIPVVTSGPLTYLAVSGFGLIFSVIQTDDINLHFNFYFGGNFQLWLASGTQGWLVGVNIIGAIGARYLYGASRRLARGDA